eukprot:8716822-Pyramimonas_sp.AAC.2
MTAPRAHQMLLRRPNRLSQNTHRIRAEAEPAFRGRGSASTARAGGLLAPADYIVGFRISAFGLRAHRLGCGVPVQGPGRQGWGARLAALSGPSWAPLGVNIGPCWGRGRMIVSGRLR